MLLSRPRIATEAGEKTDRPAETNSRGGAEMIVSQVHGVADESQNRHLRQGALLVDGIHHLNVEGRRLIESAHSVIKQDVGVLEEPGRYEQGHRNAGQFHIGCHDEQEGEDHEDRCGPAARRSEEVAQQVQVPRACISREGFVT